MTDTLDSRKDPTTDHPVLPLLAQRWSPRALDTSHEMSVEQIGSLLEAARWAPSAFNSQPWRFVVGRRGSATHERIVGTLTGNNPHWAPLASVLIVACATIRDEEGRALRWAEYDTGQAIAYLTVQAESMGLSVHQMAGFNVDDIREAFDLSENLAPMTITAVGRMDPDAELPEQLRAREVAPRQRKDLAQLVLDGWP